MPYLIQKIDGKPSGGLAQIPLTADEVERLRGDGHVYKLVSTTTRRTSTIGAREARLAKAEEHLAEARAKARAKAEEHLAEARRLGNELRARFGR